MKNARSQTAQEWVSEKYDFKMRNVEVGIVVQFPKILLKLKLKAIEFPLSAYVGKHLSLRGGIDFEGPWRDLGGGESKESPSLSTMLQKL